MHIPNGFCSLPVELAGAALAAAALGLTAARAGAQARLAGPLACGAAAAGMFAVQMLDLPVAGGTSGHALGVLAAALLIGPAAALWGAALVLAIQCLLFADGGWQALGLNILNMGVVAGLGGYWAAHRLAFIVPGILPGRRGALAAAGAAGWTACLAAAGLCGVELWLSGHPAGVIAAMLDAHLPTGGIEALLTLLVVAGVPAPRRLVPIPVRSRR